MQACQCRLGGGQQLCVFGFFISIFNTISIDNNNNVWSFLVFSSCYRICVYGNVGQFPLVFVCYWVIGSATTFIMFQIYGSFCVFLDSIENVKSNNGVTIIFYFVVSFCVSIIFSNCWFFILRLLATTSSSDHVSSISSHWCSHWHDSFRSSVYSFNLSRHHDNDLIDIDRGWTRCVMMQIIFVLLSNLVCLLVCCRFRFGIWKKYHK